MQKTDEKNRNETEPQERPSTCAVPDTEGICPVCGTRYNWEHAHQICPRCRIPQSCCN